MGQAPLNLERYVALTEAILSGRDRLPSIAPEDDLSPQERQLLSNLREIHATQQRQRVAREDAERRLRASLDTARGILNAAEEVMLLVSPTGLLLDGNQALARSMGAELSSLVGRNMEEMLPPDVGEHRREVIARVARTGRPEVFEDERAGRCFQNHFEPIANDHGVVDRVAVFARDLTAQKRAHELEGYAKGLLEAQEAERRRVARELHDGVAQLLVSAKLALSSDAVPEDSDDPEASVALVRSILDQATAEVDAISKGLRSPLLDTFGLESALEKLCADVGRENELTVELDVDTVEASAAAQETLFRIAQEALTNAGRHARASNVKVRLQNEESGVRMEISDDGVGISASQSAAGVGLMNMRERARVVGGTCLITPAEGRGTRVSVFIPGGQSDHLARQ